jgi:hypothetical protein
MAFLLLGFIIELASILKLNAGHFTYTLDDPYIHLALAERISNGHYGINASEPAAPSSSILWPFLLVPLIRSPVGEFAPLALGLMAAMGTVLMYHRFATEPLRSGGVREPLGFGLLLTLLLILATNTLGLPFTGLEHSLQVLATALVVTGMVREAQANVVPRWLPPVIILGPLIRYENLAVSLAAIAYLALRGHTRLALTTAVFALLPLLVFSAFLLHIGIGPLPSSVTLKSAALSGSPLDAVRTTLRDPSGVLLCLAGVVMLYLAAFTKRMRSERALAGCMAFAIACHAIAGGYGAYHRWEMYIVAATLLALLFLGRDFIRAAAVKSASMAAGIAVLACIVVAARYMFGLTTVPTAANNIHEQQFQMHRYILEYERGPVAVNDLGYPSYRNRRYVLDLLGLGSAGFTTKTEGLVRTDSLQTAIRARSIETALLYREWFPDLPSDWRIVGEWSLSRPRITPAWETVTIYATSEAVYPAVLERVKAFGASLPSGVRLSLTEP